ncbi:teichoic acid biosynthesis protein C [Streptomyces sp. NPDC056231]|uniref:phage baseplate protein n=1 Tax=Streptomyces sp. NPDC056231 TaxID=3345755 RepID=UPI003AAE4008
MFLSLQGNPSRRTLLGLGTGAVLAVVNPVPSAWAQQGERSSGPSSSEWTSLAAAGKPWIRNGRLRHATALQSFAFDERQGHVYALQVVPGGIQLPGEKRAYRHAERAARGDLCVNRLTMAGVLTGYMYLKGFGHGVALGVEGAWRGSGGLWTEWDANPASGYGRGICRFRFADGRVLTRDSRGLATYRPVPGSTSNYVTVDQANRRLLLRYKLRGVPRLAVHNFDRFAAGDFRPLAGFLQPGAGMGLPFQGMTLHGDYMYQMLGTGYGPANPRSSGGNTRLFRVDWRTGRVVQSLDRTAPQLYPREPEGLAVLREGGPWLCSGFTQGRSGDREFSIYYKAIV